MASTSENSTSKMSPLYPLFNYYGDYYSLNSYDMFVIKYKTEDGKSLDSTIFNEIKINRKDVLNIDKPLDTHAQDFYKDIEVKFGEAVDSISKAEYLPIRHTSIKIPQHKWGTETINFLNKKITKPVPIIGTSKKLSFSIIPDSNLEIIHYYKKMSGDESLESRKIDGKIIKDYFLIEDFSNRHSTKYAIVVNNSSLNYNLLSSNGYELEGWTGLSDIESKRKFSDHPPYWIFEDVRFLGVSSPISFNQGGGGVVKDMKVEFIYKRCTFQKEVYADDGN